MIGRKGSLYGEIMTGIFLLAGMTVMYIILQQVYEYNLYPEAVENGADATNLNLIDIAWDMWPIPVVLAILWAMINAGRSTRVTYAE